MGLDAGAAVAYPKQPVKLCGPLLVVALGLAGCKVGPLGPYVSPRVTGCVWAADSRLPLADVKVIRGRPERSSSGSQPKGAEVLTRKTPVRTDGKGEFTLQSERVLSVFRGSGWSVLRLTFERSGYATLRTNYSTLSATNLSGSEPTLNVGEVLLEPVRRPERLDK